eukprot:m.39891 g.39891  ORF g.39891 m.39891 type:complete len:597 (-) comp12712_c0_seq1:439-2229(-)
MSKQGRDASANGVSSLDHVDRIGSFAKLEMLRVVAQMLHENGLRSSAQHLQSAVGFSCESTPGQQFRQVVVAGDWSAAVDAAQNIHFPSKQSKAKVVYLLEEQHVLQLLLTNDKVGALKLIRRHLTPAAIFKDRLRTISGLVMQPVAAIPISTSWTAETEDDLRAQVTTTAVESPVALQDTQHRQLWLDYVLQPDISSDDVMPPGRLVTLLEQAATLQRQACLYHNTHGSQPSLLQDHKCTRDGVPRTVSHVLTNHTDEVWCLAFSHSGRYLATGSKDKRVIIWSADSFQQVHELHGHGSGITCVAWSANDQTVVSISEADSYANVWDAQGGISVTKVDFHSRPPTAICFLPDNRLVTGAPDALIALHTTRFDGQDHVWDDIMSSDMVTTPNGNTLIVACHQRKIHFISTSTYVDESIQLAQRMSSLSIAQDGGVLLASMLNSTIIAIDVETKVVLHTYEGHIHKRFSLRACFGGFNDSFVISASEDNSIYLWSRQQRLPLEKLQEHDGAVNQVDWHPRNPEVFASVSDDKTVRIWGTVGRGAVTTNMAADANLGEYPHNRYENDSKETTDEDQSDDDYDEDSSDDSSDAPNEIDV